MCVYGTLYIYIEARLCVYGIWVCKPRILKSSSTPSVLDAKTQTA